eukprot:scaffold149828_cov60-Attheya_sp.AAC.4
MKEKCKRDYRNRIKQICDFLSEEYPDYFAIGVRMLTAEDLKNPDMFYHKNKGEDKIVSHEHLRKYHDAIMYGSKESKEPLPSAYYDGMNRFLGNYRKETIDAKRCGKMDE